jgi:death-on-curing protein
MITFEEVQIIHEYLIDTFGGSKGIRDLDMLKSALNRPFSGSFDQEYYPDLLTKSTALIEALIKNHPFVDGNKRTGYVIFRLYLNKHGMDILANEDDKYDFVMRIAKGESEFNDIRNWIESHLVDK